MGWILAIAGVLIIVGAIGNAANAVREATAERNESLAELARKQALGDARLVELHEREARLVDVEARVTELRKTLSDPQLTPRLLFSEVATAVADFQYVQDELLAQSLVDKDRPAPKAAEELRKIAQRLRTLTREDRVSRYAVALWKREAPWLQELIENEYPDAPVQDSSSEEDPGRHYLSPEEYASLSSVARNQLALDRYWKSRKTSWQVGRDYERFVGYCWEKKGYRIQYQGIEERLQDLGRDLLARRRKEVVVIQCKHWANFRTVRERHVYQLFGTAVDLALVQQSTTSAKPELPLFPELLSASRVRPLLVTSTALSDKAKSVAQALRVEFTENFRLEPYPCIKCNVSRENRERIYHLPFDQQYDAVIIEPDRGERFVSTVAEAEALGFRRAFRWQGANGIVGDNA